MAEFVDRQRKSREASRPAVNFTRRDDVRDLMKTPRGQNYANMMDLQSQALGWGGFDRSDPRVSELKDARRQYNRQDKYNIGNLMGYDPLDVQDLYRHNSELLRKYANPTYKEMYPMSDAAMKIGESGGLFGLGVKAFTGKLGDWKKGITSMIDSDKEEQDEYVAKTFGYYPTDIHSELPIDEESGLTREEEIEKLLVDPGVKSDSELILEKLREFADVPEEPIAYEAPVEPEVVPQPYQGREFGLGQFMDTMPRDWQDYLEDVGQVGDMPGGHLTYEEWHDAMRRRR